MKATLNQPLQDAPPPGCAPVTLATAPRALAHPRRATVRLEITESEAAGAGILNRWQSAQKRQASRIARQARQAGLKTQAAAELRISVLKLFQTAAAKEWGQRRLAAETGIPQTTLRRIRAGLADPLVWLPKLQTAVTKLITN